MEGEESCTQHILPCGNGSRREGAGREVNLSPFTSPDICNEASPASGLLAWGSLRRKAEKETCHLQTRKVPDTSGFVISTSFCQMWACKERPFVLMQGLIPLESVGGLGV